MLPAIERLEKVKCLIPVEYNQKSAVYFPQTTGNKQPNYS